VTLLLHKFGWSSYYSYINKTKLYDDTELISHTEKQKEMPEFCVTGGTGFIAAYLVKALLEKGHIVRTTVRNPGINI